MITMYEVDLRSRRTGDSVECIYSGNDYDKAYDIADHWNKEHLDDYDDANGFGEYLDGKTDGLFADLWIVDNAADLHGIGKF